MSGRSRNAVQVGRDVYGGQRIYSGPVYEVADAAVTVPRELGRPPAVFVDREELFLALDSAVEATRAGSTQPAVLVGLAGVGKTASVSRWAQMRPHAFKDGRLSADLRGFGPNLPLRAEDVAGRFLRSLGVKNTEVPAEPEERLARYRSMIAGRDVLIVLDNAASAAQVRKLLPADPGALVVVTSRARLAGLDRDGARRIEVGPLDRSYSTALLRSAGGEKVGSTDSEDDFADLADLCGGLPLALCLAADRAARSRATVRALVEKMTDDGKLLDELTSADEPHLEAVRVAFEQLYRTLSAQSAAFYRCLGFYLGPHFALGAAAALAGVDRDAATTHLQMLEDLHMVETLDGDRYRLHDLLRSFAIERARNESGLQESNALTRLLSWYLHSALSAARALGGSGLPASPTPLPAAAHEVFADQHGAIAWFESERAGIQDALTAADQLGGDIAWQLPAAFLDLFATTNAFDEWSQANQAGYRAAQASGNREAIAVMAESKGKQARQLHRLRDAVASLNEAVALRTELDDARGRARVLNVLGLVAAEDERWEAAAAQFSEVAVAAHRLGDEELLAYSQANLAWALHESGRHAEALEASDLAAHFLAQPGREAQYANALQLRAGALRGLGELAAALADSREAVAICRRLGDRVSLAQALREHARCLAACGHTESGLNALDEALIIHQELGDRWRAAAVHQDAGALHRALGQAEPASEQYRIAAEVYRSLGQDSKATYCDGLAAADNDP